MFSGEPTKNYFLLFFVTFNPHRCIACLNPRCLLAIDLGSGNESDTAVLLHFLPCFVRPQPMQTLPSNLHLFYTAIPDLVILFCHFHCVTWLFPDLMTCTRPAEPFLTLPVLDYPISVHISMCTSLSFGILHVFHVYNLFSAMVLKPTVCLNIRALPSTTAFFFPNQVSNCLMSGSCDCQL